MKWDDLLNKVSGVSVFTTGFLMAGQQKGQLYLQLTRWVKSGRLIQLRKGVFTLAKPYAREYPHPFVISNALQSASYVSLQSGLAYYNLIPEYVPVVTSVTTRRPELIQTKLGDFNSRHIKNPLFFGYKQIEILAGQFAFIALPEKALFDLLYLTRGADSYNYLKELRLQYIDTLKIDLFEQFTVKSKSQKMKKIVKNIQKLFKEFIV